MSLNIVVGAQWGDEGKGRIVDLLSGQMDVVARFNGGDNAGHTVTVKDETFKLHLIPSGVIHPQVVGVLGAGMVINPSVMLDEMKSLQSAGVQINPQRLLVAYNAHVITPMHRALDLAREQQLSKHQIGTTGRGIGPAYVDKATRRGLRMIDLMDAELFREKLRAQIDEANLTLTRIYDAKALDEKPILEEYLQFADLIRPYIQETALFVLAMLKNGKRVLAEGAQGVLLDIDAGTYPFVTSSSCVAAGALNGLGIGVYPVAHVFGVVKAFQTRVGAGQFPTELLDDTALLLRGSGDKPWDEFGTTTGRPRRVGWLDGVLLRYSAATNGLTELIVTKLDVLSGIKQLKICTAYQQQGQSFEMPPFGISRLETFEPVYEELPGWEEDITAARKWDDLPINAQAYIQKIEALTGIVVTQISVGPERDQVIIR